MRAPLSCTLYIEQLNILIVFEHPSNNKDRFNCSMLIAYTGLNTVMYINVSLLSIGWSYNALGAISDMSRECSHCSPCGLLQLEIQTLYSAC